LLGSAPLARAIENQCYVLASAQFGKHNLKRTSYGHSIAIDPWGEIMIDAGGYDGKGDPSSFAAVDVDEDDAVEPTTPCVIICDLNDERIQSTRERMPIRSHRQNCPFSW
jgi:predicted amidohydrolase